MNAGLEAYNRMKSVGNQKLGETVGDLCFQSQVFLIAKTETQSYLRNKENLLLKQKLKAKQN